MQVVAQFAVAYLVVFAMLNVGLRTSWSAVVQEFRQPRRILLGVGAIDLAVPLVALIVVQLIHVPPEVAKLFLLFAICPAAPLVLPSLQRRGAAGSVGLALVVVLLAAAVVTIPAWVWILDRAHPVPIDTYAKDVALMLVGKLLLPLVVGMTIRAHSDRMATIVERIATVAFIVCVVFAIWVVVKVGAASLGKITGLIAFAALLIFAGDALLVSKLAPKGDPALRSAISSIAVRGNPALALAVIAQNDPSLNWAGLVAAYVIFRTFALLPFELRARQVEEQRHQSA
jgi:bile acid:Na+ symporter, BASS family